MIGYVAGLCKGKSKFVGKFEHCYTFNERVGELLLVDPLAFGSQAEVDEAPYFCFIPRYTIHNWAFECNLFAFIVPVYLSFVVPYVSLSVLCLRFIFRWGFVVGSAG